MILKFPNPEARTDFLARVEQNGPIKGLRLKPSYAQPTVVIVQSRKSIDDRELRSRLQPLLSVDVGIFSDVQLSPTG